MLLTSGALCFCCCTRISFIFGFDNLRDNRNEPELLASSGLGREPMGVATVEGNQTQLGPMAGNFYEERKLRRI